MDFVVVGFGIGALVLLIGLAVRDLAPRLSLRAGSAGPQTEAGDPDHARRFALAKEAPALWGRACHSLGLVIMAGGGLIVLATIVGIVGQLADKNGARLVLAATLVAFAAIVLRTGQIANSTYGADRRARSRPLTSVAAVSMAPDEQTVEEPSADAPAGAVGTNQLTRGHNGAETEPSATNGLSALPDLQALLGERMTSDGQRRDEIVTLEQFLGLTSETAQAPVNEPSESVDGDITSSMATVDGNPANDITTPTLREADEERGPLNSPDALGLSAAEAASADSDGSSELDGRQDGTPVATSAEDSSADDSEPEERSTDASETSSSDEAQHPAERVAQSS